MAIIINFNEWKAGADHKVRRFSAHNVLPSITRECAPYYLGINKIQTRCKIKMERKINKNTKPFPILAAVSAAAIVVGGLLVYSYKSRKIPTKESTLK